jgi:hypothetical protein
MDSWVSVLGLYLHSSLRKVPGVSGPSNKPVPSFKVVERGPEADTKTTAAERRRIIERKARQKKAKAHERVKQLLVKHGIKRVGRADQTDALVDLCLYEFLAVIYVRSLK